MEYEPRQSLRRAMTWLKQQRPSKQFLLSLIAVVVVLAAAFGLSQTASADPNALAINPLRSPIKRAIIVKVNCSSNAMPICVPVALSTIRAKVTSHFYIDGQARGPANRIYRNVCSKYSLSAGYHSVRVSATDSRGNSADTGTRARAIRCR